MNRSVKSFLQSEFQKWYSDEVAQQLNNLNGDTDNLDPIDLTTARMKCVKACIHCTQVPETSFDLLFLEQITQLLCIGVPETLQCMQALSVQWMVSLFEKLSQINDS